MRRKKSLPGLKQIREKLSSAEQLDRFVDLALDALLEIMEADTGWLQLLAFGSGKTLASAWRGFTGEMKRDAESLVAKEVAQPLAEADTIVVTDLAEAADPALASFVRAGFASLIVVPLRTNLFQGFLGAVSREPATFNGQSAEILKLKASLIGAALEKGALSRGLADLLVGRPEPSRYTRELKRITAIAGRRYGEVRRAIEKAIRQTKQADKKLTPPDSVIKPKKAASPPATEISAIEMIGEDTEPMITTPPTVEAKEPAGVIADRVEPESIEEETPPEKAAETAFEKHADRMLAFRKSHTGFR